MKSLILALTTVVAIYSVNCDVYFDEKFPDGKSYWYSFSIYFCVPAFRVLSIFMKAGSS